MEENFKYTALDPKEFDKICKDIKPRRNIFAYLLAILCIIVSGLTAWMILQYKSQEKIQNQNQEKIQKLEEKNDNYQQEWKNWKEKNEKTIKSLEEAKDNHLKEWKEWGEKYEKRLQNLEDSYKNSLKKIKEEYPENKQPRSEKVLPSIEEPKDPMLSRPKIFVYEESKNYHLYIPLKKQERFFLSLYMIIQEPNLEDDFKKYYWNGPIEKDGEYSFEFPKYSNTTIYLVHTNSNINDITDYPHKLEIIEKIEKPNNNFNCLDISGEYEFYIGDLKRKGNLFLDTLKKKDDLISQYIIKSIKEEIYKKGKEEIDNEIKNIKKEEEKEKKKEEIINKKMSIIKEKELKDIMNMIIKFKYIYEKDRFQSISLSLPTKELVNKNLKNTDPDFIKLNRLLLEDAYPGEITKDIREDIQKTNEKIKKIKIK